ncbi:hypothetical protein RSAG8_03514, partial [Rhizoctonia solani AG-8 WAC10335]
MSRILSEVKHNYLEDYGSAYGTNWRGIEANWYPLWADYLIALRDAPPTASERLSIASQHPLVQWDVTRAASLDMTIDSDEETSAFRVKDTPEWNAYALGIEGPQEFTPISFSRSLRSASKAATDQTSAEDQKVVTPSTKPTVADTPLDEPSTAPDTKPIGAPSSTTTRRANRSRDSYFYIDFAVIEIAEPSNARSPRMTYGRPTPLDLYQESLIAIAAAGPWWSFTLIKKTDRTVMWSKAYKCGNEQHDGLLRKLFAAVKEMPTDPIKYDNGCLVTVLTEQKRTTYNGNDCLSVDVPANFV